MKEFLEGNSEMDIDNPIIKAAAKEAVGQATDDEEIAKRLFYYVRDEFRYNMYPKNNRHENYIASSVLINTEGWCLPKSTLMVTLARVMKIPARIRFAEVINYSLNQKAYETIGTNHFSPHTYSELFINGRWIGVTPVFDKKLCANLGVPTVEFDGRNPAMLGSYTLSGEPYMEYIRKTPAYAKLPWGYLLREIRRLYKEKAPIWFADDFEKDLPKGSIL